MELSDLEKLWKENDRKLDRIIKLNEKIFSKLNGDAVSEMDRMVKLYVMGRNLALVYFAISVILSCTVISKLAHSIPGLIGGLLMLWSFLYYLKPTEKLRQLDYSRVPVVELQKTISEFRIWAISAGKYDFIIVFIWAVTVTPLYFLLFFDVDMYAQAKTTGRYLSVSTVLTLIAFLLTKPMLQKIFEKLKMAESSLDEVIAFEAN